MLGLACDPRGAGIYAIVNLKTQDVYIGSSVNIARRWYQHRSQLRLRKHHCAELQGQWTRDGEAFFAFIVLERTGKAHSQRIEREQWWISNTFDVINTSGHAGSGPKFGHQQSEATKSKRSATMKGRKQSPEHTARHAAAIRGRKNPGVSAARKGKHLSAAHRAKISAAQQGQVRRPGTGARISAALTGRTFSAAHRAAISAAKRGKPRNTPTARARLRDSSSEVVALTGSMDQIQPSPNDITSVSGHKFSER